MYVPSTSPVKAKFVFVFAVVIDTLFHTLSAALVILAKSVTVTLVFTIYAVPISLLWTTALSTFTSVSATTLDVGGVVSTVIVFEVTLLIFPAVSVCVTLIVFPLPWPIDVISADVKEYVQFPLASAVTVLVFAPIVKFIVAFASLVPVIELVCSFAFIMLSPAIVLITGAFGACVSTVIVFEVTLLIFPAISLTFARIELTPSVGISLFSNLTLHTPLFTTASFDTFPHTTFTICPFWASVFPVTFTPAVFSARFIILSVVTSSIVIFGGVVSTSIEIIGVWELFPALSVTIALNWYFPSAKSTKEAVVSFQFIPSVDILYVTTESTSFPFITKSNVLSEDIKSFLLSPVSV